jgi:hypothetical protein
MVLSGSQLAPIATRLVHPLSLARAIGPSAVEHAVHGLVLFVAIVGATFVADYPAWRMLLFSAGAVVLFWVAHVYAAALADEHEPGTSVRAELAGVGREAKRTLPLLEACVAPAIPLILAMAGVLALPLAYLASLAIGIASLAAVGFLALRNRRASLRRSLVAAAVTGGIGAVIIAAETFWH